MRFAAKFGANELDWSILDVEQEEWERRLAAPGAATVPAAWNVRHIASAIAIVGMLAVLVGYGVWCAAQAGIARMQLDVANAVKLESLHARSEAWAPDQHAPVQVSVHEVEFLDNAAMATVLVTHTLGGEAVLAQELHFYVQTAKGWQRSEPLAAFWGRTETLDTAHLHFVFGSRDQAVVAEVAPSAEALYIVLRRATGVELAAAGRVQIEIVPGFFSPDTQLSNGRIQLTSPSLYRVPTQQRGDMLGHLLRRSLCDQLMAAITKRAALKTQWQPLVQALGVWLAFTEGLPFAPDDDAAALVRLRYGLRSVWQLDDLLGDILRYDPQSRSMQVFTLISDPEQQKQRGRRPSS